MKKNISINISGIIFHIEEDGYETLRKYLDSVNKYFASFDDNSEILADIEGRIAEIFLSRLNDGKQVITAEDVSNLMSTMGSVSDFKAAEEQDFAAGEPAAREPIREKTPPPQKKLFRDQNRKILGGVCSGLGHYFNIDPVWPRLLLALLTVGTSGFFLLVYVVLWIVLPAAALEEETSIKKMYRDPDKKVVAGVSAGIAAFFGTDTSVIRLIFVLLAIFGGLGIVTYIVLWIVLPEAKTITEKMQMQGEPVTLSNIESTVKRGLNEKPAEDESILARIILFPFRALGAVLTALGPVLRVMVDVVRVAIGILFTLTGLCIVIALVISFGILLGLFHAPDWQIFSDWYITSPNIPLSAIRNSFPTWTVVFTFLAALIPAMFMMLLGNSIIAKRIVFNPTIGWSLFVLFFISVVVVSFSLPGMIYSFKEDGEYKVEQLFPLSGKTPVLKVNETGLDDYDVTSITLRGYEGKEIKLIERFQAQGPSRKVAGENAQMVNYNVIQSDSVITFDSNLTFKDDARFRAQRLDVDVFIPFGQAFVVDENLWRLIDNYERYRFSRGETTQTWKITEQGLECISCPTTSSFDSSNGTHDQFGLKDFNSLDLQGLFNVRIEKGSTYAVEIGGDPAERSRYDIYVNGETLVVDYDDDRKFFWKRRLLDEDQIRITITMPQLRELDVKGAGKVKFIGFDENEVDVDLMGAIMADGELTANSINVNLTGASFLDLTGKGRLLEANITGASGLRAYGYEVRHCIVEAHGASMAKVNVTETLEIEKGIASSVSHRGNPEVIKR